MSEFCTPGAEDKEAGSGMTFVGREQMTFVGREPCWWGEVGMGGWHRDSSYSGLSWTSAAR